MCSGHLFKGGTKEVAKGLQHLLRGMKWKMCQACYGIGNKKVDLKYKSPLVNSVPLVDERLYRGVDTPTMQSYNPFRGLHLEKKKRNLVVYVNGARLGLAPYVPPTIQNQYVFQKQGRLQRLDHERNGQLLAALVKLYFLAAKCKGIPEDIANIIFCERLCHATGGEPSIPKKKPPCFFKTNQ